MAKRYYWLKLKTDFFNQLKIKKMRKLPHGIDVLIIYLKLLLLSVPTDGIVEFIGLEDAFSEELSLAIDEDAEKVQETVDFLFEFGMMEQIENNKYRLIDMKNMIGSETDSARRVRKHREAQRELKLKMTQEVTVDISNEEECIEDEDVVDEDC